MPYPDSEYPSILRGRDKRESQRLLAAAQHLLEAVKIGLEWSESDGTPDHSEQVGTGERAFRINARAAIAMAEGRE